MTLQDAIDSLAAKGFTRRIECSLGSYTFTNGTGVKQLRRKLGSRIWFVVDMVEEAAWLGGLSQQSSEVATAAMAS